MVIAQTNIQLLVQLIRSGMSEPELARVDAAYRLTIPLFSDRFRSDGRPFLAHLCGTASLVAGVTSDVEPIVAALLHAVFSQGALAMSGGATKANQARVAAVAGLRPVALILAYDRLAWTSDTILDFARATAPLDPTVAAVLILRLANEVEDHVDGAVAFASKSRYSGQPALLDAIDAIDAKLGPAGLARLLREGVEVGAQLAVPAAIRRSEAVSFDAHPQRLGTHIGRIRRVLNV